MPKELRNRRLNVWHRERHDNFDVSGPILAANESAQDWINEAIKRGGFWSTTVTFVPWHSVSFIELLYE